jgi:hypothetical protein
MHHLLRIIFLFFALTLAGCASVSEFPTSAAEVDFDGSQGHTGWAKHERTFLLRNTQLKDALPAAAKALRASQFVVVSSDPQGAVVMGEHGETTNEHNLVAALYFRPAGNDLRVRIQVQASRGLGFLFHQVEPNWDWELEVALRGILNR